MTEKRTIGKLIEKEVRKQQLSIRICKALEIPESYLLLFSISAEDIPENKRILYNALCESIKEDLIHDL